MKIVLILAIVGIGGLLVLCIWGGCRIIAIVGNGRIKTEERTCAAGVRRIVVSGPWQVEVFAQAETDRCVIRTDENLFEHLTVSYQDGTVAAEVRGNVVPSDGLRLTIYTRGGVEFLSARGSGDIHVNRTKGERMTVELTGSGDIELTAPELRQLSSTRTGSGKFLVTEAVIDEVNADATGSGELRISGELGRVKLTSTGSGDVEINQARSIELNQTGSGNARLTATETISGTSTGSGDIICSGGARVAVKKFGSGELRVENQ